MTSRESKPKRARRARAEAGVDKMRIKKISTASAQIVREAAALLDEELAAGIIAARKMQDRFQKERRIDFTDFNDPLRRFQGAAHEVVTALNEQVAQVRTEENGALVERLVNHTHGLLDLLVGLVNVGAEIANRLVQANVPKRKPRRGHRRGR